MFRVEIVEVNRGWDMNLKEQVTFETRELAVDFISECNKDLPAHGLPKRYMMARGPFENLIEHRI